MNRLPDDDSHLDEAARSELDDAAADEADLGEAEQLERDFVDPWWAW
jgi:hypothetical protein